MDDGGEGGTGLMEVCTLDVAALTLRGHSNSNSTAKRKATAILREKDQAEGWYPVPDGAHVAEDPMAVFARARQSCSL